MRFLLGLFMAIGAPVTMANVIEKQKDCEVYVKPAKTDSLEKVVLVETTGNVKLLKLERKEKEFWVFSMYENCDISYIGRKVVFFYE